jgi:small subunit ribosomal protein S16
MKQMGRAHRPFYRICAMDKRAPRDGKVLEELGIYDPMVPDTDARVRLNGERVDYWLGVGAQPSEKVAILIKKYGTNGTHVDINKSAVEKLAQPKAVPERGEPKFKPEPVAEPVAEESAEAAPEEGATEAAPEEQAAE